MTTTPEQRLAAAERELAMRQRVYPGWVARGTMTDAKAAHEIAAMADIVEVLKGLAPSAQPSLFDVAMKGA